MSPCCRDRNTPAARGELPDTVLPLLKERLAETRAAIDALLER